MDDQPRPMIDPLAQEAILQDTIRVLEERLRDLEALEPRYATIRQELDSRTQLLEEVERVGEIGGWEVDVESDCVRWSDGIFRIHELEVGPALELEQALSYFPGEARTALQRAIGRLRMKGTPYDRELPFVTATGRQRRVRIRGEAQISGGRIVRLFGTLQDVTDRQRVADELRMSQLLLSKAAQMANIGAWSVELPSQRVTWSDEVFRIHDLPVGELPGLEGAIGFYTPAAQVQLRAALERLIATGESYDIELPMVTAKGRHIWARSVGELDRAEDGTPACLYGVFQDVTERRRAEEELRLSEERLWLALRGSDDGVWDWDIAAGTTYFSPRLKELLGYAEHELHDSYQEWESRLHPEDRESVLAELARAIDGEVEAYRSEFRLLHRSGGWVWMLARGKAVARDGQGRATRMVGTHSDITEQVELREELVRAKEGAEAAARAKAEFLATMSHEIRTPMNGILGMAQLLAQSPLRIEQRECAETIYSSGSSLLAILNDILDLSKVEAGKLELERVPFDLCRCLSDVVDLLGGQARSKSIALGYEYEESLPRFFEGDPGRLRQIVLNLVGNALKFTEKGRVLVRAVGGTQPEGEGPFALRIAVEDTGIGIPADKQAGLFDSFSQADASTTRRFGGTGLGLTICRRLTELMQGEIELESEEGRGSTFTLRLNLPRAESKEAEELERRPVSLPKETPPTREVLVVEDNHVNQIVARKMLQLLGCIVDVASNGREALARVEEKDYDVVFMDCQMPEMDGFEATRNIREREAEQGGHLPIVAMTANALQGDRERCLAAGMDEYLAKPIVQATLVEILGRMAPPASDASPTQQQLAG